MGLLDIFKKEPKSPSGLPAGVVLALTRSTISAFEQRGLTLLDSVSVLLGLEESKTSGILVLDPGKSIHRINPAVRTRILSLRVYRDSKGGAVVAEIPLQDNSYQLVGKPNLGKYATAIAMARGIDPIKQLMVPTIEHVPGPSRFWRCPHCRAVLQRNRLLPDSLASGKAQIVVFATCANCKSDINLSGDQNDLPEVKLNCPHCGSPLQGPAEELLGNPCPACKVRLPLE